MQLFTLIIVKFITALFSLLPLRLLFVLADVFHFFIYRILKYRKSVIQKNLSNAFPGKNLEEINEITKKFYRYLSELVVESIKGLSFSKKELQERFVYKNPEIFDSFFEQKKSVILLGSHYGNWEWGTLSFPLSVRHKVVGIYKPLKNRKVDAYLNHLRVRWGL